MFGFNERVLKNCFHLANQHDPPLIDVIYLP